MRPSGEAAPRYIPGVLKLNTPSPDGVTTITPPLPPSAATSAIAASAAACAPSRPMRTASLIAWATPTRMKYSPAPVHDRSVHLDPALRGEDRAAAGVEMGIVLEHQDRRLDGVERRAAAREERRAGIERTAQSRTDRLLFDGGDPVPFDHAGAAM